MSDKELPPSDEKIRQGREKGQLGVSQDVITLLKLAAVFELAVASEAAIRDAVGQLVIAVLRALQLSSSHPFPARMTSVWEAAIPLALIILEIVLVAAAVSWLGTLAQTRMNVATKVFSESFQKLNPISNLKQIFSGQKLMMVVLGPLKIVSVLIVLAADVWKAVPIALQADRLEPWTLWHATLITMRELLHSALLVMVCWTLFDVGLQRWLIWRSLRMDVKEMKEEYKNMEGDPNAKGFRKSTGKEVLMSSQPVHKPAVVVVNPEHFAVALAYDYQATTVPLVVGKGVGDGAQYWKQLAKTERIPVIRFQSLARQLYAAGKVGDYVPSPMLAAVALLFQAALEAAQTIQADGDTEALYEIDEDMAQEMLATAPSQWGR
jgi:type III secretion protein U